jgi:hypothetical protein
MGTSVRAIFSASKYHSPKPHKETAEMIQIIEEKKVCQSVVEVL